jgi:IS4 transposase
MEITSAAVHDVNMMDELVLERGSFLVFDRAYIDFARLNKLNQQGIYFITRAKSNMRTRRVYSHKTDKTAGILRDQTVKLTVYRSLLEYPQHLRKIRFYDPENNRDFVFITNNFDLSALTITQLYKQRWQVELFFKWIKQHLRIKTFFGISENAVKTHIWIAISTYVLVIILKKRLNLTASIYQILQVLSVNPFEKIPISQLFTENDYTFSENADSNQLFLFK